MVMQEHGCCVLPALLRVTVRRLICASSTGGLDWFGNTWAEKFGRLPKKMIGRFLRR